jgi:hypothetical protein
MLAAVAIVVGVLSLVVGLAWGLVGALTQSAFAASPEATAGTGGDPRSSGQGPGLVGDPLTAILLVLAIGLGAAVATAVYVRLTGGRRA